MEQRSLTRPDGQPPNFLRVQVFRSPTGSVLHGGLGPGDRIVVAGPEQVVLAEILGRP